ncbi:MAG: histidine kinase [Oscillospiraceae bacterium]|nr:histidine kinase [Candidatus Ruminococcus equi]
MKNRFSDKNKKIALAALIISALIPIILIVWSCVKFPTEKKTVDSTVQIVGVCSLDGGREVSFDSKDFSFGKAKSAVVKGKIVSDVENKEYLIFQLYDVWCTVKADGKIVCDNTESKAIYKSNTPGYSIKYVDISDIQGKEIEITLNNPYPRSLNIKAFEKVFSYLNVGDRGNIADDLVHNQVARILIGLVVLFFGLFGFGFSSTLFTKQGNYLAFALFSVSCGLYFIMSAVSPFLPMWIDNPILCMILDEVWAYLVILTALYYFCSVLSNKKHKITMNILFAIGLLIFILACVFQILGVYDILLSHMLMLPIIIVSIVLGLVFLLLEYIKLKNYDSAIILFSMIPILVFFVAETINGITELLPDRLLLQVGLLLSIAIQFFMFAKATNEHYKEMLEVEKMQAELLESRISIMVSQIQPHFLYNALTSIAMLCEKNPKTAKKATIEFADYLRGNMNSLKENNPIPFARELEHLKTYLDLEKMRFGDDLNIEYDIRTTDFSVPALSVQPLVENAVKHGVGMKEDGGTVRITTLEDESTYQIIVEDDGVGFDTTKAQNDTKRQHIGMENCKSRIKTMCNGEVVIESTVGVGTVSKIIIPKGEENDDDISGR